MQRDHVHLEDMRNVARDIARYVERFELEQVWNDPDAQRLFRAVFGELGESAGRVSEKTKSRLPSVPWRQIIATRNKVVHDYERVNYDVLYGAGRKDIPVLIDELNAILDREDPIDETEHTNA